jgi:hypothetical protein
MSLADKGATSPSSPLPSTFDTLCSCPDTFHNMKFLGLPDDASPRLKAVQIAQLSIVILTLIATFLAAVIPQKHKSFTFSLLYSLILTSITTTFLVRKEQLAAATGALTKDKYVKYQLIKMISAVGLYIVGFIMFLATPNGHDTQRMGEQGLWMKGVKVNRYQGWILWMHFFNWYVNIPGLRTTLC